MAWAPRSLGCSHRDGAVSLHFWLHDMVGPPDHIEPAALFSILAQIARDIRVRLHFAIGVPWIKKPSVHVQIALAEGNRSLAMGASTKGARHCIRTSGTPLVSGNRPRT